MEKRDMSIDGFFVTLVERTTNVLEPPIDKNKGVESANATAAVGFADCPGCRLHHGEWMVLTLRRPVRSRALLSMGPIKY